MIESPNDVAYPLPPRSRRQLLPLAVGVAALLIVGAVVAQGLVSAITPDWGPVHAMESMQEWNLPPYPGATATGEQANPREPFWDWSDDTKVATVYHTYTVRADWDAVSSWYDTQLEPLGWRHPCAYGSCLDKWHRTGYDYWISFFSYVPAGGGEGDFGFSAGISVGTYAEDWAPTRALQSLPAASLQPFPGAVSLADEAWPRTSGTEAQNASLSRRFGVDGATIRQVLDWYDTQFRTLGWTPACTTCADQYPDSVGEWFRWNPPEQIPSAYELIVAPMRAGRLQPGEERYDLVFSEVLVEVCGTCYPTQ